MKHNTNPKIVVLTTVHQYSDPRIFFKEIPSIKNKYPNLVYIAKHKNNTVFVENEITIDPLPISKSRFERFFKLQYLSYNKIKKHKPDVIHFHDPELMILMWFVKKRFKCKVIFDIHESIAYSFNRRKWIPNILKPVLPWLYNLVESFFIKDLDVKIIVLELFKELYGTEAKVIMNYPLLSSNQNIKKEFNDKINFVYVGVIMRERGFPKILQIFLTLAERYNNVHFNLIGKIDTKDLEEEITSFIRNNNLNNNITLHGVLHIKDVYTILEKSHLGFALLEPNNSFFNALATKIFDYMANGVPYIVSDFSIYQKYTNENHTGITVDYHNENEIIEKIETLLNNRTQLMKMSNNGIKNVYELWNWENEAEKLLLIYDNLFKE